VKAGQISSWRVKLAKDSSVIEDRRKSECQRLHYIATVVITVTLYKPRPIKCVFDQNCYSFNITFRNNIIAFLSPSSAHSQQESEFFQWPFSIIGKLAWTYSALAVESWSTVTCCCRRERYIGPLNIKLFGRILGTPENNSFQTTLYCISLALFRSDQQWSWKIYNSLIKSQKILTLIRCHRNKIRLPQNSGL
jgi:hypothetical protein